MESSSKYTLSDFLSIYTFIRPLNLQSTNLWVALAKRDFYDDSIFFCLHRSGFLYYSSHFDQEVFSIANLTKL